LASRFDECLLHDVRGIDAAGEAAIHPDANHSLEATFMSREQPLGGAVVAFGGSSHQFFGIWLDANHCAISPTTN
jgi:hypothetical protein